MKTLKILLIVTSTFILACQPVRESNSSAPFNSSQPAPSTPTSSTSPATSTSDTAEKESEYKGYHYFYKQTGVTTVALFAKRFLPRDDAVVVGAMRDVIRKAYKEETYGAPYLVDYTTAGGTAARAIRVDGPKHGYVVLPVKEDTGEIHSLTITQVNLK